MKISVFSVIGVWMFVHLNKKLPVFLTVIWICIIFSFSIQSGTKSEQVSDGLGQLIIEHSTPEVTEKFTDLSVLEWKTFHKFIRKCAHLTEFFILGILASISTFGTNRKYKNCMIFLLCAIVAILDEAIQLFVPGRSGQWTDVLLDCGGGLTGMSVFRCFTYFLKGKKTTSDKI